VPLRSDFELQPASSLATEELASLFTRGYEGYVIPFEVDAEALRFMVRTFDLLLDASRVAFRNGEAVGIANLGIRDTRGWVGGVGVVAGARREGVGQILMEALHEEARARGLRELWLEVIEENEAAFRLYEKLGYELFRWVEVATLDQQEGSTDGVDEVPVENALAQIRALRRQREPWQREDETLAHYDDLRGLVTADGAAVYRIAAGRVTVLQHVGDEASGRRLLQALQTHGPVTLFNVPADDPVLAVLHALGGRVIVRQREMVLTL
jgi:GNAT superfamily N-acetyltransferase